MPVPEADLSVYWALAAAEAERGDNRLLAAFLRDQKDCRKDVDLALLANLLDGTIKPPRKKRLKLPPLDPHSREFAEREARHGKREPLVELLGRLGHPYDCPDLRFLARVLNGEFRKSRGRPELHPLAKPLAEADMRFAVDAYAKAHNVTREKAIAEISRTHPWSESALTKVIYNANKKTRYSNNPDPTKPEGDKSG